MRCAEDGYHMICTLARLDQSIDASAAGHVRLQFLLNHVEEAVLENMEFKGSSCCNSMLHSCSVAHLFVIHRCAGHIPEAEHMRE